MSVPVSQILELPIFRDGAKIVSGQKGINSEVHNITVMEVPDFADGDLGEGLFILTTFYSFKNDSHLVINVVRKLCEKNISALVIKINRFIFAVPDEIHEITNNYNIPLILIEKDIPFRDIIKAVTAEIINYQYNTIKGLNQQHEILLNAILKGENLDLFINRLGNNLNCDCICISLNGKILSKHFTSPTDENGIASQVNEFIEMILHQDIKGEYVNIKDYSVFPCFAYNRIMGYLFIKLAGSMNERELLHIRQTVSFLSIKFLEQHLKTETEQHMITAIIDDILFRNYADEAIIRDRLKLLGLVPQKYHFIIILSLRQYDILDNFNVLRQWGVQIENIFPNSINFVKGTELVGIVTFSDQLQDKNFRRMLQRFFTSELSREKKYVDIGYTSVIQDLRQINVSYEQAKNAIRFGRLFKPDTNIFFYGDFIETGLLSRGLGTQDHVMLLTKIVDPMIEYDKKYNSRLWETLEKSLFAASLEQAAEELHIHPSTLRYRLQKIESITQTDYFTHRGRFLLQMAYLLAKIEA